MKYETRIFCRAEQITDCLNKGELIKENILAIITQPNGVINVIYEVTA